MNPARANVALCAILTTLLDCPDAPQGIVYAALSASGYTLNEFNVLLALARSSKLIEENGLFLSLTPSGRDLAQQIEDARRAA